MIGALALKLAVRDQRGDLAVQVLTRPLVERVEELLSQVDRGLPLLEVLELEGGPGPGLEHQGDVVRIDAGPGQDAVVDRLRAVRCRGSRRRPSCRCGRPRA